MNLLEVKNIHVDFQTQVGKLNIIRDLSFNLAKGEALGIVGESGSGKSVTSLAILQLLPASAQISHGQIFFQGQDLLKISETALQKIRGSKIAMIFQDPMTSLNPCYTIGDQICEMLKVHEHLTEQSARDRALALLSSVGIPDPAPRLKNFPHEMSGGMSQRIMIAMAMSCRPELLIADEPTTALDVTIQAQILELLKKLRKENNMSLILVSHDLGVISENTDRVAIMYAGELVESGETREIISKPQHPYTAGLLSCLPGLYQDLDENFRLPIISGTVGNFKDRPVGCQFFHRCQFHDNACNTGQIPLISKRDRFIRCVHPI